MQAPVYFILGGPGSGKGTNCTRLVTDFGFVHISAGDLLRDEAKKDTSLGKEITAIMAAGQIVPSEVTMRLLTNVISSLSVACPGFLIDGFPRKLDQAEMFERDIATARRVLYFDCSEQVMEQRLIHRGNTSGGSTRPDANPEAIRKRFRTNVEQCMPVVDKYKAEGRVDVVNCNEGSIDEIYAKVKALFLSYGCKPKNPYMALKHFQAKAKTKITDFWVTENYDVIKQIGNGSYGVVVAAKVHNDPEHPIAIKQIAMPAMCEPRAPHPLSDFEIVASRTLREIRIVRFLEEQVKKENINLENFILIKDILQLRSKDVDTIYTVTQLMSSDLHAVLRNPKQSLGNDHVQYIMYNLLRALNYLHSTGVAHRDIKPQNILVNDNCDVVICDFGLAREISDDDMTVYVETRWYRAPELIMGLSTYDEKVDIWSLGCVMAEMLMPVGQRNPLWRGSNAKDQLDLILCTLGIPSKAAIGGLGTNSARTYVEKMRAMDYVPKVSELAKRLPPSTDPKALDLLNKMLAFLPEERLSAEQCLAHPYLEGHHDESDEPKCSVKYVDDQFDFVYDTTMTSRDRSQKLKGMLYEEMLRFHPELVGVQPVPEECAVRLESDVVED